MIRLLLTLLIIPFSLGINAQMRWNQAYQQYINQYKDLAIEQMHKYSIPASITLAQGLFESGAGLSALAKRGNNHFGIKCHGWTGAKTYHTDDAPDECFRAYRNVRDSYEDHSRFLVNGNRYRNLFRLGITDYKGWARGLKAAGYATNPKYADRLIEIIQLYRLYEYDRSKGYNRFMVRHSRDISVGRQDLHPIYEFNKNYYLKARAGDTFKSISKEVGISYRALARYNERDRRDVLDECDIVYFKKKKTKAPKAYKGRMHYVRAGESMYTISQLYGIRLRSLYKMNRLSPYYQIKVGDRLKIR